MSGNILRDPMTGRLLPGTAPPNPYGRPTLDKPKFNRDRIIAVCERHDYEPIGELIAIARSSSATPYLRFEVAKEIAAFLYPKQKTVQLTDGDGEQASIRIQWDDTPTEPPKRVYADVQRTKGARQFEHAMQDAEGKVMEAVLADDDE